MGVAEGQGQRLDGCGGVCLCFFGDQLVIDPELGAGQVLAAAFELYDESLVGYAVVGEGDFELCLVGAGCGGKVAERIGSAVSGCDVAAACAG